MRLHLVLQNGLYVFFTGGFEFEGFTVKRGININLQSLHSFWMLCLADHILYCIQGLRGFGFIVCCCMDDFVRIMQL